MTVDELAASRVDGPHALLARLVGSWEGTARTWFRPDELGDESRVCGTIRTVLGGRFALHEYHAAIAGDPLAGIALIGYDLGRRCWLTAWADSFHNGSTIMLSRGEPDGERPSVLGSYADPGGGPDWGWRTELTRVEADRLVVTHFNVTAAGEEAKAVEFDYDRRSA